MGKHTVKRTDEHKRKIGESNKIRRLKGECKPRTIKPEVEKQGRVFVWCNIRRKRILRYRYVMEQHLNRQLTPDEHIHHKDGNKKNDCLSNLLLLSNSKHRDLHIKKEGNAFKGKRHTDETKIKLSELAKGRPSAFKGKKHSNESKQKLSNTLKGRVITKEWREKLSKAGKGRVVSDETKRKLSEKKREYWKNKQ